MAGPAIAGASMGLSAAGNIISGLGQQQQAEAQAGAYRYKAGVALLNKQINEQNAAWAEEAGQTQAEISGMKSRAQIGETKVAQAASGFDVNTGTAAQVRASQANISAFDQNTIRWNAAKEAYGYETKASMDVAEASLDRMAADQSEKAGQLELLGSFINAGGNVAGKWMQARQTGML